MIQNICRPIVLINKQIHATIDPLPCDYIIFGDYDGINIYNNIFDDKNEDDFIGLWYELVRESKNLNGYFVSRIIFGFRCEDKGNEVILDQDFHDNKELPFFFISMLQYKEYKMNLKVLRKTIEMTINKSYSNKDALAISYLTIDNANLILMLKTRTYDIAVEIINHYRHVNITNCDLKLNYSYTIFGFSYDTLNRIKDYSYYDSLIDEVDLYLIENNPGTVQNFKENMDRILNGLSGGKSHINSCVYEILGIDDVILKISKIKWSELLPLYKDKGRGILMNENEEYLNSTYSVTTRICTKQLEYKLQETPTNTISSEELPSTIKTTCDTLRYKVLAQMKIKQTISIDDKMFLTYGKALLQILNSLKKYERTDFSQYVFISIFEPLQMFIKLIYDQSNKINIKKDNLGLEFLTAINIHVQNTTGADRSLFEAPNFNTIIYNSPVKLNSFYASYAYYISELLSESVNCSDDIHEYKFLICPWMEEQIMSYNVFKENPPGDRLILIKVPERLIFHPSVLMIMIVHEIAHFVGNYTRNRERRYQFVKEIVRHSLSAFWIKDRVLKEFINEKDMDKIKEFLKEKMDLKTNQYFYTKGILNPSLEELRHYSSFMKEELQYIVSRVIAEDSAELFLILKRNYYKNNNDKINELYRRLSDYDEGTKNVGCIQNEQRKLLNYEEAWEKSISTLLGYPSNIIAKCIELFINILSETYADLMSVMVLKIKPEDYINTFLDIFKGTNTSLLTIRITLVVDAMRFVAISNRLDYTFQYSWDTDWTKLLERRGSLPKTLRNTVEIVNKMMLKLDTNNTEDFIDAEIDKKEYLIFNESEVWDYMLQYLCICKRSFEESHNNDNTNENYIRILEFYHNLKSKNIETSILKMENIIDQYTALIYGV